MAGIDAIALAGGEASISIECSISDHWSAGGTVSYGFGALIRGPQDLEISHRQELGNTIFTLQPRDLHRESLHVRYWPVLMQKGPYLLTGVSHGTNTGTGLNVGAGFLQHIWKSIYLYTEYCLAIPETGGLANSLRTGICLTFGSQRSKKENTGI